MTVCAANRNLGRESCGQVYGGELQHCVARVSWSMYADGRAHVTASRSLIDRMWAKGNGTEPVHPGRLGAVCDARGRWRMPDNRRVEVCS